MPPRSATGERMVSNGIRPPLRTVIGVAAAAARSKTIKVVIKYQVKHEKYGKYLKHRGTVHAHDERNEVEEGDTVEIAECRPLSKTKHHRLVRIVQKAPERTVQLAVQEVMTGYAPIVDRYGRPEKIPPAVVTVRDKIAPSRIEWLPDVPVGDSVPDVARMIALPNLLAEVRRIFKGEAEALPKLPLLVDRSAIQFGVAYITAAQDVDDALLIKARQGLLIEAFFDASTVSIPAQIVAEAFEARRRLDSLHMLLDPVIVGPVLGANYELVEQLSKVMVRTTGKTYEQYLTAIQQKRSSFALGGDPTERARLKKAFE